MTVTTAIHDVRDFYCVEKPNCHGSTPGARCPVCRPWPITITPEERYAAANALRRLRDVKSLDECQSDTITEVIINAVNGYRDKVREARK
jgi:hypothetical protein